MPQAHADVPYPVYIAGTQVTSANRNDVFGDGTVSYEPNAQGGTLYLNDFNAESDDEGNNAIKGIHNGAGLYAEGPLTLVLQGEDNWLFCDGVGYYAYGIYVAGDLTVTAPSGCGDLGVILMVDSTSGYATGVYIAGNLTVETHAGFYSEVSMEGSAGTNEVTAIRAEGNVTIKDRGYLDAFVWDLEDGEGFWNVTGLYCGGDLLVTETGGYYAEAAGAKNNSIGTWCGGSSVVFAGATAWNYSGDTESGISAGLYVNRAGVTPQLLSGLFHVNSAENSHGTNRAIQIDPAYEYEIAYHEDYGHKKVIYNVDDAPNLWECPIVRVEPQLAGSSYLYAPNVRLIKCEGNLVRGISRVFYQGTPMVFNRELNLWCTLSAGSAAPNLQGVFTYSNGLGAGEQKLQTLKFGDEGFGDVNQNGQLNVVDAQLAYDMATGKIAYDASGTDELMRWLTADVNADGHLDAVDSFAIQNACLRGWALWN